MTYSPEYRCVNGHDRCAMMLPGPDCPYCEKSWAISSGMQAAIEAYAARKVARERERCAQLIRGGKTGGSSEYARGWDDACDGHAAAILNQERERCAS
jgi:hypothetical protein